MNNLMNAMILGCAVLFVGCTRPDHVNQTDNAQQTVLPLVGKTIAYQYGESIYHVTIDSDTTLHWQAMTGPEKGMLEYETYRMDVLDGQTIFISWGEANGTGVSQILDFTNGVVYNHLLRGREVDNGRGIISFVE